MLKEVNESLLASRKTQTLLSNIKPAESALCRQGAFFSRMEAATVKKSQRMSDLNGKKRQKKHI